jgi:hypothetical protein
VKYPSVVKVEEFSRGGDGLGEIGRKQGHFRRKNITCIDLYSVDI